MSYIDIRIKDTTFKERKAVSLYLWGMYIRLLNVLLFRYIKTTHTWQRYKRKSEVQAVNFGYKTKSLICVIRLFIYKTNSIAICYYYWANINRSVKPPLVFVIG
jgi:hypothetical protein